MGCALQKCIYHDHCHCNAKRRIGSQGPTNPSFGMTPTIDLQSAAFADYIADKRNTLITEGRKASY